MEKFVLTYRIYRLNTVDNEQEIFRMGFSYGSDILFNLKIYLLIDKLCNYSLHVLIVDPEIVYEVIQNLDETFFMFTANTSPESLSMNLSLLKIDK